MKNAPDITVRVSRFLSSEMSVSEQQAFERELQQSSELRAELDLQRDLREFLQDSPENQLRHKLATLRQRAIVSPDTMTVVDKRRVVLISVLVLLFAAAVWYLVGSQKIANPNPIPPAVTPATPNPTPPVIASPTPTPVPENRTEPIASTSPSSVPTEPVPSSTTPGPIAANFTPNDQWEFLRDNQRRSVYDLQWRIERKPEDRQLNQTEDSTPVEMTVVFDQLPNATRDALRVHIFDNSKTAYERFQPTLSRSLIWQDESDGTVIGTLDLRVVLSPGLYYCVLENETTEAILFVDRFRVDG